MSNSRRTTKWVPIDALVPHPENPNRVPEAALKKLANNIRESGRYPPLIVRDLSASESYAGLLDRYQVLDGEHRLKILQELGESMVHVDVWEGVNDAHARVLLLTLNRLSGRDDQAKRSKILRELLRLDDADAWSEMLPETAEELSMVVPAQTSGESVPGESDDDSGENDAPKSPDDVAADDGFGPLTFFVDEDQRRIIRTAIRVWLKENDPESLIERGREGVALAAICQRFDDDSS